jgi:hypothetical protein
MKYRRRFKCHGGELRSAWFSARGGGRRNGIRKRYPLPMPVCRVEPELRDISCAGPLYMYEPMTGFRVHMNFIKGPAIGVVLVNAHEQVLVDRSRVALALLLCGKVPMCIKAMRVPRDEP